MHLTIDSMPVVPLFLLKLSVSLAAVWCFYQVVLRRLTFFKLNRWYLAGYTLVSIFVAFIDIGPMIPEGPAGEPAVIQYIPAIGGLPAGGVSRAAASLPQYGARVSEWTVVLLVLALGAGLLLLRSVVRWASLLRLRRSAKLIEGEGVRIYQVDEPIIPFSFGNAIYINQRLHSEKEWEDIILHEYVHIRQKHTADILLAELLCIVNWYNPFAWLIRHSIRQNLEFLADQQVLENGVDRKGYQYHLLKVVGEPRYRLANNFNFSSLRKRIIMMNKMRSAKAHLLKLLFVLPLVAVLLLAFRNTYPGMRGRKAEGRIHLNVAGIAIVLPDRTPIGGVTVRDEVSGVATKTDERGFYRLQIPAMADSPLDIHLNYYKKGYDSSFIGWSGSVFKETTGMLNLGFVIDSTKPREGVFMGIPDFSRHPIPAEPGYEDAVREMNRVFTENDRLQRYMQMKKDHPEIGLFYQTEDRRKEIVIHMDGSVEKYGFPGTPGLDELSKKYGDMAGYMATDHPSETPGVNAGYLARWAAIGEQAQRDFHTTNTTVRAIIFPGDSRVIAVPATGKPRFYDMDSKAENERAEFERLYGPLPDCVPKPGGPKRDGAKDTVPHVVPGGGDSARRPASVTVVPMVNGRMLYVVNGKPMPEGWLLDAILASAIKSIDIISGNQAVQQFGARAAHGAAVVTTKGPWKEPAGVPRIVGGDPVYVIDGQLVSNDSMKTLNPERIKQITVLKDDSAAVGKYGEKAKNGVVFIETKGPGHSGEAPGYSGEAPLYIVDGKEMSLDSARRLNPNEIESMNVLKGEAAVARYGGKGKNGVVLITMKHKSGAAVPPRARDDDGATIWASHGPVSIGLKDDKGEPMTITADTIRISKTGLRKLEGN